MPGDHVREDLVRRAPLPARVALRRQRAPARERPTPASSCRGGERAAAAPAPPPRPRTRPCPATRPRAGARRLRVRRARGQTRRRARPPRTRHTLAASPPYARALVARPPPAAVRAAAQCAARRRARGHPSQRPPGRQAKPPRAGEAMTTRRHPFRSAATAASTSCPARAPRTRTHHSRTTATHIPHTGWWGDRPVCTLW
jgi:hypothetical protein